MRFWRHHSERSKQVSPSPKGVRRTRNEGEAMADDAEAFLAGRLAEHFEAGGRPVPGWAATNLLTHSSYDELEHQAMLGRRHLPRNPAGTVWRLQERILAWQLISIFDTPDDLRAFQFHVLMPLESALTAADDETVTPHQAMTLVSEAVETYLAGAERRER